MMKTTFYLATFVIVASFAVTSKATLIASDSFATSEGGNDYVAETTILGKSPTVGAPGFVGAWVNPPTEVFVPRDGGLSHPLTPGATYDGRLIGFTDDEGFANLRLSREIVYTPTDGTYYMSVLLQTNQERQIDLFAGLAPSETVNWSFGSDVQGTYVGIQNGNISFLTTNQLHHIVPHAQVNVGETYFALMQFDYSTSGPDTATATIYDGSSNYIESYPKTNLDLDGDISHFGVITSDFSPNVAIDEWRFGTELNDVMVVPTNGDFDDDGDVDGADFLMWQRGESTSPLSADDLIAWETNYGTPTLLAVNSTEVPEPASEILIVATALIFILAAAKHQRPWA